MPPACPVEPHVRRYHNEPLEPKDATGLPGGVLTLVATTTNPSNQKMPPACPVECSRSPLPQRAPRTKRCHRLARWTHARRYPQNPSNQKMPPACPVECSRSPLPQRTLEPKDATGLPGGVLTLAATTTNPLNQKMPPACPVECSRS